MVWDGNGEGMPPVTLLQGGEAVANGIRKAGPLFLPKPSCFWHPPGAAALDGAVAAPKLGAGASGPHTLPCFGELLPPS